MLDDIVAYDIAQGINTPIPTPRDRLPPPWARIASRLRAHPTGLALLISEQTFQEQTCIRRNTILREQRTYPFLDFSKRRRPQRKRLFNRRCPRPRHPNHVCPWIQKPATKATVMLVRLAALVVPWHPFNFVGFCPVDLEASHTKYQGSCRQAETFGLLRCGIDFLGQALTFTRVCHCCSSPKVRDERSHICCRAAEETRSSIE